MDLAFFSGSQAEARRSVLALQSTPRRAKEIILCCAHMPGCLGASMKGNLHLYSHYFLGLDPWRSDTTKSTFAVRNINMKFPPSFKNMTECK
jgi:hypothetical protein